MGLGYIGLPTSIVLANSGIIVTGVDINKDVIAACKKRELHIVEPGLNEIFVEAIDTENLKFSDTPVSSDIFIICVPTPFSKDNSGSPKPDISYIESVAKELSKIVKNGDVIILESTSPVGTTNIVKDIVTKNNKDITLHFAYCPERVLPGNIIYELINNDRIIGGIDPASNERVKEFYSQFVKGSLHITDAMTAELSKLIENSYRDVNIAFANEISMYCKSKKINAYDVIDLANKHPRVNIMTPGIGVGGHCIAVDPWFLVSDDPENTKLIKAAREVNDFKTDWAYEIIKEKLSKSGKKTVGIYGLAYKPNIDDLRESPSLKLAKQLREDFNVICVEPNVDELHGFDLHKYNEALDICDLNVVCIAHKEFLEEDFLKILYQKDSLIFCKLTK